MGATFVGRDAQIDVVERMMHDATARSSGSILVVAGEAGVGKTALARACCDRAIDKGWVSGWGTATSAGWRPAYDPWTTALDGLMRRQHELGRADEIQERAAGRVRMDRSSWASLVADIVPSVLAPGAAPRSTTKPASAEEARFRLHEAVTALVVESATPDRPFMLVLDDVQWADADSLSLLGHVAPSIEGAPIAIFLTLRSPDPERPLDADTERSLAELYRLPHLRRFDLVGLSVDEIAQLGGSLGQHRLPTSVARAVHLQTGGNAFFASEVVRSLVEEQTLADRESGWSIDVSEAEISIPATVRQVVLQRLTHLPSDVNDMLTRASALTGTLQLDLLQTIADGDIGSAVDLAVSTGFLRPAGPGAVEFSHPIVGQAVHERLGPAARAELHRDLAVRLEASGRRGLDAELAAQYHKSATLPGAERGVEHCLRAAERAHDAHAPALRVQMLERALDLTPPDDLPQRGSVLTELAVAMADALRLEDAVDLTGRALVVLREIDPDAIPSFAHRVAASLKEGGADRHAWEAILEQGLAAVGPTRDLAWARLELLRDPVVPQQSGALWTGRWTNLEPLAIEIARRDGDEHDDASSLTPWEYRPLDEVLDLVELARGWNDPFATVRVLDTAARMVIFRFGQPRLAAELYRELRDLSDRVGWVVGSAESSGQLALCHALLGELDGVDSDLAISTRLTLPMGYNQRLHLLVTAAATLIDYIRGEPADPKTAQQFLDRATHPGTGRAPFGFVVNGFAALSAGMCGDEALATRILDDLVPLCREAEPQRYVLGAAVAMSAIAVWNLGLDQYAEDVRTDAQRLLDNDVIAGAFGSLEWAIATTSTQLGDLDRARASFTAARQSFHGTGHAPFIAIADHQEAVALGRLAPDLDRERDALEVQARRRFEALGMDGWLTRSDADEAGAAPVAGLTKRETEVLALVAAGQTNKEIAANLFLSPATVERHVANLYRKIGTRNRAEATAFARDHHIG